MIKKIPLPITGVALGTASLGNLLESYSKDVRLFCGAVAALFLILYLIKMIRYPALWKEDMKNPITAGVFATFFMAWMLLAGYLKPYAATPAFVLWCVALSCHALLIVYFTWAFIRNFKLSQVFPSYYIAYVGIVVGSVSCPAFNMQALGTALFWFGLVMLFILLVLVTVRYIKCRPIPEPAQPLFCIYTAPTSLCLTGYMQASATKSPALVVTLMALACVLYLIVLANLPRFLRLKFYPSYAAFTFPFVISAIAMKQSLAYWTQAGVSLPWLNWVVLFETVVATVMVTYTIIRYLMFLFSAPKVKA